MRKLGRMLLEDGVITKEQLATALRQQENQNGIIGTILLTFGFINEEILKKYLKKQREEQHVR